MVEYAQVRTCRQGCALHHGEFNSFKSTFKTEYHFQSYIVYLLYIMSQLEKPEEKVRSQNKKFQWLFLFSLTVSVNTVVFERTILPVVMGHLRRQYGQ